MLLPAVAGGGGAAGRTLREISLETPIRYGANDPVEAWLYRLLCLDAKVCCLLLLAASAGVNTMI